MGTRAGSTASELRGVGSRCSATVECAPRTSSSGRDEQTEHERVRKPSPWSHAATVDAKSLGRTIAEAISCEPLPGWVVVETEASN